jgi:hypothetical protein
VRRRNRDTTLALFRGVVDRCVILDLTTVLLGSAITFVKAAVSVVLPWST